MNKPIVFIDIDGVLNPSLSNSQAKKRGFNRYRITVDGWRYTVFLDRNHGAWLKKLDADLVWATTWEHWANEYIGPKIGLPELPVVEFSKYKSRGRKTSTLVEYANGRPFIWLDDDINDDDLDILQAYHCMPQPINHTIGLTYHDILMAHGWINENYKPRSL